MPDLRGLNVMDASDAFDSWAESAVGDWYGNVDTADLSPLARSIGDRTKWVIVAMSPAPGAVVTAPDEVTAFALKASEISWFKRNRSMPRLPRGEAADLVADSGPLADVSDLVEFRYSPEDAPEDAREVASRSQRIETGPAAEPKDERQARLRYFKAYENGTLVTGQLPAPGEKVRMGRILVVTVRDEPEPEPDTGGKTPAEIEAEFRALLEGGGGVDGDYVPGGGGGVDVPDRLCPTRFC